MKIIYLTILTSVIVMTSMHR